MGFCSILLTFSDEFAVIGTTARFELAEPKCKAAEPVSSAA
jgi:hypothetical protein